MKCMRSMRKKVVTSVMSSLMIAMLASGCGKENKEITEADAAAMLESLLADVSFDTQLSLVEKNTELYFPDLPEGTVIQFYTGSGYYADEVAMFTLANASSSNEAVEVIENHVEELKNQFMNYVPEEVGKIDDAIVFQNGSYIFLCITDDTETAKEILENKKEEQKESGNAKESDLETSSSEVKTTEAEITESESNTTTEYPKLQSKSGTYYDYGTYTIRVDDSAFEMYEYVDSSAGVYVDIINSVAKQLEGQTNIYSLLIPTAIGIVLPDDIAEILPDYTDQGKIIEKIFSKMSDQIVKVNCFDNLMKHRDEYLYFHTDFHWNGRGAYYAYEAFCEEKNVKAISLEERIEMQFEGFIGGLYWNNCSEDEIIGNNPDTVLAYLPKSTSATMEYTDAQGNTYPWNIITDVSDWKVSKKYSTFAGADNPISVFTNPEVTDGSVCVIVKESYGNALLPYLVDHYSTIYEIDYRYWEGNLVEFVKEKNADDVIFANNLSMLTSNYLIGKLNGIVE